MISTLQRIALLSPLLGLLLAGFAVVQNDQPEKASAEQVQSVTIEDFSRDSVGQPPSRWRFITSRQEVWPLSRVLDETRSAKVIQEGNNKFMRIQTKDRALRITLRNEADFNWSLDQHTDLQWDWRAMELPTDGREDRRSQNSVAAAVYVTFGSDWLGRPQSIKYTYSTTLPVGTVVSQGPLRVMVISSGTQDGTGQWKTIRRDVVSDYRQVFGGDPPQAPLSITAWSDSDSVPGGSIGDFDNFKLMPSRR